MVRYAIVGRNDKNNFWTLERCTFYLIHAYIWKFIYSFKYKQVEIRKFFGEQEPIEKWRWNYGSTI